MQRNERESKRPFQSLDGDHGGIGMGRGVGSLSRGDRTDSYSEKATEGAESCRRYADIVTYLAGVTFPLEAVKSVSKALEQNAAAASDGKNTGPVMGVSTASTDRERERDSCYEGVPLAYQSRLPFWTLLSEPWLVVTPLLHEVRCPYAVRAMCTRIAIVIAKYCY